MTRQSVATGVALAAALGLAVASLLAWVSLRSTQGAPATGTASAPARPAWERELIENRTVLRSLIDDPGRLEEHIRKLSRSSSLAGSEFSMRQVEYVENFWRQLGFKVVRRTYEVPMSYFNLTEEPQPSVSICQQTGDTEDCSPLEMDKPLTPEDAEIEGISRSFYSHSKPLSGDFGLLRLSDTVSQQFDLVEALSGKLVLVQPNETSVMEALMSKAVNLTTGFLLVHSPPGTEDAAVGNETSDTAYPNGTGSPDTAVTFHLGLEDVVGDPTTPGYPSHSYAVRRAPKNGWDSELNATVVPISLADAARLDKAFVSRASNVSDEQSAPFLRVNWPLRFGYRPVHDSCAEVLGWAEPDRVVLLGSHRDAWYGGAIDPHTGVATMLETGRALAQLMRNTGWRPRRTILMCAWDAEEIGLMGSVEWVEEEYQRAGARLVAYFNTDTDVMGNWKILVQASDQMVDAIRGVMSEVPNPTASLTELPAASPYFFFRALDDASDYFAFTRALGAPACDLSYIRGPREALVLYDLYHTRYETLRLYHALDPGGLAHRGLTQSVAALVYTFAESPLLPLNMSAFAEGLRRRFAESGLGDGGGGGDGDAAESDTGVGSNATADVQELLDVMRLALENATRALHRFEGRLARVRAGDASAAEQMQQRMLNDKIMQVQKAFTHHCIFPCEGVSVNLLNELDKAASVIAAVAPEKVYQAIIHGLTSVPKILTDSFVEE